MGAAALKRSGCEYSCRHEARQCHIGAKLLNEGDFLSLDGNTGAMYLGRLAPLIERPIQPLAAIASWSRAAAA